MGRQHRSGESGPMKHLLLFGIILAVSLTLLHDKISRAPYGYDEADYMFAASLGIENNWLDAGSMPIDRFVAAGRRHSSTGGQQVALSALIRSADDPVFYRHWHGPLYYFWLAATRNLKLDEHGMRAMSLVVPLLTGLAIYFGSLLVLGGKEGTATAILGSALFLWSPVTLETSELAPHMLFVLWYICALTLLAKAAIGGGRRYYYVAVIFAGLAFATMEVTFVLILVLMIFAWWQRGPLGSDWRLARNSVLILGGTILLVWPSGLFKLSFIKAYLVMVYLAVFRKGAWGDVTLAGTWAHRLALTPVEWCLFAVSLIFFIAMGKISRNRRERPGAGTFLLFALLMILATFRVYSEIPRYTTPFFAALELFAAWVIGPVAARFSRPGYTYGALAAICCLLIWNTHRQMSGIRVPENPPSAVMLTALRTKGLSGKSVLAPTSDIPMLHYYFPRMRVDGYSNENEIPLARSRGNFDAVIHTDNSVEAGADELRR